MTAQTRLSAKGQVVIPKDVRDRLAWLPGMPLDVEVTASGVILRPTQADKGLDFDTAMERLKSIIRYDGPRGDDQAWHEAIGRMFEEEWRPD